MNIIFSVKETSSLSPFLATSTAKTSLLVDFLIDLLSFCLDKTYFVYDCTYYQQVFGTAMGSPVSAVNAKFSNGRC